MLDYWMPLLCKMLPLIAGRTSLNTRQAPVISSLKPFTNKSYARLLDRGTTDHKTTDRNEAESKERRAKSLSKGQWFQTEDLRNRKGAELIALRF